MIFPKTTESNTRIPKNKFYANLELTPAVKKAFVDQIKAIHWRNKIAPSTSNIEAGTSVKELEVLEISLNCGELDEAVLRTIDRQIPYHILFLLSYEDKYQAVIGLKEASHGTNAFAVGNFYRTPWLPFDELPISLDGFDLDEIFNNLILQISGIKVNSGRTLREQVAIEEQKAKIQKQLDKLERMTRKEIQPKKKFDLYQQVQALKKQLEEIENG